MKTTRMSKAKKNVLMAMTLKAGGYFKQALEAGNSIVRLHTADGEIVPGFGLSSFYDNQSCLRYDAAASGSEEYVGVGIFRSTQWMLLNGAA